MNNELIKWSAINSIGTFLYIALVAAIMTNIEKIMGDKEDTMMAPVAFLLLFVLSATITGSLVLGRPILFYLDGRKKDAVKLFLYTIGWLFILTVVALGMNILL